MKKHDFSHQRFRASASGLIMTDPRGKTNLEKYNDAVVVLTKLETDLVAIANKETKTYLNKWTKTEQVKKEIELLKSTKDDITLSETTKSYLVEVYINVIYGRKKDIVARQVLKGLVVEEVSISLLSEVEKAFFVKNEEWFTNKFHSGTPDIIQVLNPIKKRIRDIKSTWDIFSFFQKKMDPLDSRYYWQLQTYMDLTDATEASLDYCLVNTPPALIESEKRKFVWSSGIVNPDDEIQIDAFEAIEKAAIYDDVPPKDRVFSIPIERNQDDIDKLHERVEVCRKWMNDNLPL